MDRGLYVAATGMLAEMNRQAGLSNNLANITTPGYKADQNRQVEFASLLLAERSTGRVVGTQSTGPVSEQAVRLQQGRVERTDQPLDFALQGDGFFAVQTQDGVAYTRNGRFTVNGAGQLSDEQGNAVLSSQNTPIFVGSNSDALQVRADGTVTSAGQPRGQINVVQLTDPEKIGMSTSLWTGTAAGGRGTTQVVQGAIEGSGSDATSTMVEMITSQRALEANQRVMRTIDESLSKAATLGSVNV